MKTIEIQNGSLLILLSDNQGKISYISDEFAECSGYPKEDIVGKPHEQFCHRDVPKEIFNEIKHTTSQGEAWKGYLKYASIQNEHCWIYSIITRITMPDTSYSYLNIGSKATYDEIESFIDKTK